MCKLIGCQTAEHRTIFPVLPAKGLARVPGRRGSCPGARAPRVVRLSVMVCDSTRHSLARAVFPTRQFTAGFGDAVHINNVDSGISAQVDTNELPYTAVITSPNTAYLYE